MDNSRARLNAMMQSDFNLSEIGEFHDALRNTLSKEIGALPFRFLNAIRKKTLLLLVHNLIYSSIRLLRWGTLVII